MANNTISDKVIENNTRVIEGLKMTLDVMKNEKMDFNEYIELASKKQDDLDEMMKSIDGYANTAETMSRYLGMEEGTKRQMEIYLSQIAHSDENIKTVLKHGNPEEVKKMMIESMLKITENMEHASEQDRRNYEMLIEEVRNNDDALDWDKIKDNANSLFFPLTQKFVHGAEVMRETVVDKFPFMMRFVSKDMVEHYKQGLQTVTGMLKTEFSTVLAPLEAITGPFMAVIKGGYILTKTLLTKSNEYEKMTAIYSKKNYELFNAKMRQDKKDKMLEKPETKGFMKYLLPIAALLIGFVGSLTKQLSVYWKPIKAGFKFVANFFSKEGQIGKMFIRVGKFFTDIVKGFNKLEKMIPKTFMVKLLGAVGRIFGKFLMPLMMVWEGIKGWMKGDNLRDKILGAASGILSVFLDLPEMVVNWLLSMFTDFRVDFGADAITNAVNMLTEGMYKNITEPFLDWLLIDLPNLFTEFGDAMGNFFVNLFDKIGIDISFIKNSVIDWLIGLLGDVPFIGKYIKKLSSDNDNSGTKTTTTRVYRVDTESVGDLEASKANMTNFDTHIAERAKASAIKEQIKGSKDTVSALNTTNRNLTETNTTNKQIIQNQEIINVSDGGNEIPTDPEAMGVVLFSKTWGMG